MRLKIPHSSANEIIISLINEGYNILRTIENDRVAKKKQPDFQRDVDLPSYRKQVNEWGDKVEKELISIFPTELEKNIFLDPEVPFGAVSSDDYDFYSLMRHCKYYVRGLENIRTTYLSQYTDLPIKDRLYVEDIDSFQKVRDINPAMVSDKLKNGFLDLSEDQVQLYLEQILSVSFHKKDWGGEINDLYTANLVINGERRASAFLLKGPGIGKKEMTIADCGKNGDQIVRLFTSPADLYVIQYVGPISDMLIKDVQGKISELLGKGRKSHYLIIDGQDTARLFLAYGKL